jgi:hypothetical protein
VLAPPRPSRAVVFEALRMMMSPRVVIGSAKPELGVAHTRWWVDGSTVRTWLSEPFASRVAAPDAPPTMMSSWVVIGFAKATVVPSEPPSPAAVGVGPEPGRAAHTVSFIALPSRCR